MELWSQVLHVEFVKKITYVLWTYFFSFFCPVFRIESQSVAQARHKFTNPLPQPPECQNYRCVPPYSENPCLVPFPLNFLFLSFLFLSFLYFLDFLISSFFVVLCTTPKFHTLVLYPWATSPVMHLCFLQQIDLFKVFKMVFDTNSSFESCSYISTSCDTLNEVWIIFALWSVSVRIHHQESKDFFFSD